MEWASATGVMAESILARPAAERMYSWGWAWPRTDLETVNLMWCLSSATATLWALAEDPTWASEGVRWSLTAARAKPPVSG
jgi:hypothetical protein